MMDVILPVDWGCSWPSHSWTSVLLGDTNTHTSTPRLWCFGILLHCLFLGRAFFLGGVGGWGGGDKAIEPGLITQRSVSLCNLLRCDIALQQKHESQFLADATFFCLLKKMHIFKALTFKLPCKREISPPPSQSLCHSSDCQLFLFAQL